MSELLAKLDVIQNRFNPEQILVAPEPLRAPFPSPMPYPVDALGKVLGEAAKALHETVQAPITLCCQSVLASAALATQAHFDVLLPWGQRKPLSLFLLTVAESGERKTGIDDMVLGAVRVQERQDMECYALEVKKYEVELSRWKNENEAANKRSIKEKSQIDSDFVEDIENKASQKPEAPMMPIRFVTDPTVEGLYKLMTICQPSVGLFSDEAGLLIGGHALNSENALKTMARWCKFWDGAPFDRIRAGDVSGVLYGRRLSMHQLAQPDVMSKLLSDRTANGQGFLARCLVAWPESTIGFRHTEKFEWAGDRYEIKRLFAALKALTETIPNSGKTVQELDPIELSLEDDAKQLSIAAYNKFETLMKSGNDLAELRDRAAKALENACRIAGVLSVIDNGINTKSISKAHLERGLILIQWYLREALRIRSAAVIPQSIIDAETLSRWLDSNGIKQFNTSPILTRGPSQLRNKTRLLSAIKELVSNGYVVENPTGTVIGDIKTKFSWSVMHVV